LGIIDFFLQDWGNQVLRASLSELASRFLTLFSMEIIWVLAKIAILLIASR